MTVNFLSSPAGKLTTCSGGTLREGGRGGGGGLGGCEHMSIFHSLSMLSWLNEA